MTLGILVPSRGRPDKLTRFIKAVERTAPTAIIYVRLDDDDESDYLSIWGYRNVRVRIGSRVGLGASLNELAYMADRQGMSHIGMFGDDVLPETVGWDEALIEALGDDLGVAYGDDGLRKKHAPDLPTHYVTQTEVYRRLGYLAPPGIKHLFLDNVARDVGNYLRNFVFVPVSIRHIHPWAEGEHLHDTTYAEGGRNAEIKMHDRKAYLDWSGSRDWKRRLR